MTATGRSPILPRFQSGPEAPVLRRTRPDSGQCTHEANIPAQSTKTRQDARFPTAHVNHGWTTRSGAPTSPWPQAAHCLNNQACVKLGSLSRRSDFDRLFRYGNRKGCGVVVVTGIRRDDDHATLRLAVQIRRAFGCAVHRNKIRRRLRTIVRNLAGTVAEAWDIVIGVRPEARDRKFQDLEHDVLRAFDHIRRRTGAPPVPRQ